MSRLAGNPSAFAQEGLSMKDTAPGAAVDVPAASAHQETLSPCSEMDQAESKVCSWPPHLHLKWREGRVQSGFCPFEVR